MKNILTIEALEKVLTPKTIRESTYTLRNKTLIRLFNTNETEAHVPALYQNTKENLQYFKDKNYANVTPQRVDQINSDRRLNRKIDLDTTITQDTLVKQERPLP